MSTKIPTVWEEVRRGTAQLEGGPVLDTPAWFAWLAAPTTTSFVFPVDNPTQGYIEGFLTVRKEPRQRGTAYWTAYWRVSGRLQKVYLGSATAVTLPRLRAIAATWLAQIPGAIRNTDNPSALARMSEEGGDTLAADHGVTGISRY